MAIDWQSAANRATAIGMPIAVVTLFLSAAGLGVSTYFSIQARDTAAAAFTLSQEGYVRQLANRVYIGEATGAQVGNGPSPARTVVNATNVVMFGVWVEGHLNEDGKSGKKGDYTWARIETIPGCRYYLLPDTFTPSRVHFFDGTTHWVREESGQLRKESNRPPPKGRNPQPSRDYPFEACSS